MSTRAFFLEPVDVWFFGDGRPYHRNEASQTAVKSVFPPHPPTVMGALRADMARNRGWRDGSPWPPALKPVLGWGAEDMGPLRMRGPYLARRPAAGRVEVLWPLPAHVVGASTPDRGWSPRALLAPAAEAVPCDLGDVRLPVAVGAAGDARLRGKAHHWVDTTGLVEILTGRTPAAERVSPAPWRHEMRVGIVRDEVTRSTGKEDRALYSPLMVRMHPGMGLVVTLSGLDGNESRMPAGVVPLGGESRLAVCHPAELPPSPACPTELIRSQLRCVVVHLGPARLKSLPRPGEALPGVPGTRVVSACLPPAVMIGGWDGTQGVPLGLVPHLAPGSVWFCDITDPGAVDAVLNMHDRQIGERPEQGFGHIALGAWPEAARREP
jgi:CRISPR-associated protein Cmr3